MPVEESQFNIACDLYMQHLYETIASAASKSEVLEHTQGEVLFASLLDLFAYANFSDEDIFLDCGSAAGRVLIQAYLMTSLSEMIGIEIQPELHDRACLVYDKLQAELPRTFQEHRAIHLYCGDFLEIDYQNATVVFISAVCFSQSLLMQLANKLNQLKKLRCVLSLKPLTHFDALPFDRVIRVECSWGPALCYCYRL